MHRRGDTFAVIPAMVLFASVVLFTQLFEVENGYALENVTFNNPTLNFFGPNVTHLVRDEDWDNMTLSFNVGYCHPVPVNNKSQAAISYFAFKADVINDKYGWPYAISQVILDRPPRVLDILGYSCPKLLPDRHAKENGNVDPTAFRGNA